MFCSWNDWCQGQDWKPGRLLRRFLCCKGAGALLQKSTFSFHMDAAAISKGWWFTVQPSFLPMYQRRFVKWCVVNVAIYVFRCLFHMKTSTKTRSFSLIISHSSLCLNHFWDFPEKLARMLHQRWNAQPSSYMAKRMRQGKPWQVGCYVV